MDKATRVEDLRGARMGVDRGRIGRRRCPLVVADGSGLVEGLLTGFWQKDRQEAAC